MLSWSALIKWLPVAWGRWSFLSAQNRWGVPGDLSSSRLSSTRERRICKRSPTNGHNSDGGTGLTDQEGLCSLEKGRLGEILLMYISTWREGAKKTQSVSFQWCPATEYEAMFADCNTGGSLWTLGEPWNRFPRQLVECPSLKTVKSCLGVMLGNWLYGTRLTGGIGQDDV